MEENLAVQACLQQLQTAFPTSIRVLMLLGMKEEATGNNSRAEKVYNEILKQDAQHIGAFKRKIAVLKAGGKTVEALQALNKLTTIIPDDVNVWQQLVELYIELNQVNLAKFAAEEIILLQPTNYLAHMQYAEILYTLGDKSSLKLSRQYYVQSLELKPDGNVRAKYGLLAALKASGAGSNADATLYAAVKKSLLKTYTETNKALLPYAQKATKITVGDKKTTKSITVKAQPTAKPAAKKASPQKQKKEATPAPTVSETNADEID
jgi:tetratricopeptide (TPR) repeat protein